MLTQNKSMSKTELQKNAWTKVTGAARYVNDIAFENLHYAVVLRSPHHHARIIKIDSRDVLAIDGVDAILTAKDIPGKLYYGELIEDRPILADGKVRFMGEPIALVIAKSLQIAQRARDAIKVQYQVMDAVFDPLEALAGDAILVHDSGNLVSHYEISQGNIVPGFAESEVILDETFHVPRVYPGYLEIESSTAEWHEDGTMTVWVSTQEPFTDRRMIGHVLGLPEEKIQVKVPAIGGAFGGKEDSSLHILAALGAWKIKGAVRPINRREESFLAHPKRHPAFLHYRLGARRDGTLTALQAEVYLDTGAYASYGPAVGSLLAETIPGPYRIPHIKTDTYVVYTNSPIGGAMRGFGSPQTNFAYESLMDMLAEKLELDPAELRRKNIWQPGDRAYTRVKVNQAESLGKILDKVEQERERLRIAPAVPGKVSGVGFALAMQTMGLGFRVPDDSANRIEWLPDGRVLLWIGAPDLGQGLSIAAAQITAKALEIDISQVDVAEIDTGRSPDGGITCASRMTYLVGNSIIIAAREAINALLEEASRVLKVPKHKLHYERGTIYQQDQPDKKGLPAAEFISRAVEEDRIIQGLGVFSFPYGEETPGHLPVGMPHVLFCFGAQVARVEVDPELGKVEVKEIVAINDVGKVINLIGVEGQIEGGVSMGLGYALSENMALKQDGTWVSSLSEYLMPTAMDMPQTLKSIILEVPEESGPFGAKGIGEITLVPTAAAIANAIYDATRIRAKSLPISPEVLSRV